MGTALTPRVIERTKKLTQKCGADVFRYLIARFTRFAQMRQLLVQHTFELERAHEEARARNEKRMRILN